MNSNKKLMNKLKSNDGLLYIIEVSAIPPKLRTDEVSHKHYFESVDLGETNGIGKNHSRQLTPTEVTVNGQEVVNMTRYFDGNKINYELPISANDFKSSLIADMTALGMEANILNAWAVPKQYVSYPVAPDPNNDKTKYFPGVDDCGGFEYLKGKTLGGSFSYTNVACKNFKARYHQSVKINVYSPASGAILEKNVYDLVKAESAPSGISGGYSFPYSVIIDPRPDGCPIFYWAYNDGGTPQDGQYTEFIKGSNWKKIPIVSEGLNGGYFSQMQMNQQKENAQVTAGLGILSGAAMLAAPPLGMALTAATTATQQLSYSPLTYRTVKPGMRGLNEFGHSLANQSMLGGALTLGASMVGYAMATHKQQQQQEMLNLQGITASRPILTGTSDTLSEITENGFKFCISRYDDEDMIDYDIFLLKFGYNVGNTHIGTQHFWSRQAFVYMKINEIEIASEKAGSEMLDKVAEQLKAGVRIWRKAPNIEDMTPDKSSNFTPPNIDNIKKKLKRIGDEKCLRKAIR